MKIFSYELVKTSILKGLNKEISELLDSKEVLEKTRDTLNGNVKELWKTRNEIDAVCEMEKSKNRELTEKIKELEKDKKNITLESLRLIEQLNNEEAKLSVAINDLNAKEEEILRLKEIEQKYIKLTDRDEKGKFKK